MTPTIDTDPRRLLLEAARAIAAERGLTVGPAQNITIETIGGEDLILPVVLLETK